MTRFQYAGTELVAEYNASGALLRRYVHGPGEDDPVVWYEGPGFTDRRWLHADERGSIVATSNSAATITAINAYDEYGIPASTNSGRFGYTGQTWLPELGLWYYKARIYSPTLGRFMQTDPIGYGDGINWYDYVGGDPINDTDPSGACALAASGCNGGDGPIIELGPRSGSGHATRLPSQGGAAGVRQPQGGGRGFGGGFGSPSNKRADRPNPTDEDAAEEPEIIVIYRQPEVVRSRPAARIQPKSTPQPPAWPFPHGPKTTEPTRPCNFCHIDEPNGPPTTRTPTENAIESVIKGLLRGPRKGRTGTAPR